MAEQGGGVAPVEVPHASGVAAEVNASNASTVTMWLDGISAQVAAADVPKLQGRGWLLFTPDDLEPLAAEAAQMAEQLALRTSAFVTKVRAAGVINTTENHELNAMQIALNTLNAKVQTIVTVAGANFPVVEGPEDPTDKATRLAADMAYHGWDAAELQKRYALTDDEVAAAAAVVLAPTPAGGA